MSMTGVSSIRWVSVYRTSWTYLDLVGGRTSDLG